MGLQSVDKDLGIGVTLPQLTATRSVSGQIILDRVGVWERLTSCTNQVEAPTVNMDGLC